MEQKIEDLKRRIIRQRHGGKRPRHYFDGLHWLIRTYLHYAFTAAIHGYPISIKKRAQIKLVHEEPRKFTGNDHLRYVISERKYSRMFSLMIYFPHTHEKHYKFFLTPEKFALLKKLVNSDAVFHLEKPWTPGRGQSIKNFIKE